MGDTQVFRASVTAPVNIAVIKSSISSSPIQPHPAKLHHRYWGKRDTHLNLPTNSSLSISLSQADLRTHTTASCSPSFPPATLSSSTLRPKTFPRPARKPACTNSGSPALPSKLQTLPSPTLHLPAAHRLHQQLPHSRRARQQRRRFRRPRPLYRKSVLPPLLRYRTKPHRTARVGLRMPQSLRRLRSLGRRHTSLWRR